MYFFFNLLHHQQWSIIKISHNNLDLYSMVFLKKGAVNKRERKGEREGGREEENFFVEYDILAQFLFTPPVQLKNAEQ